MDPDSRSAARLAALIAVPAALLAGVGVFVVVSDGPSDEPGGPSPTGPAATGPVTMEARELTEREETVCLALLSQLPGELGELPQRPVTEGPEQNAAYGDPPITVACGVPEADYELTAQVWSPPGGVCWYEEAGPDGSVWTTVDREVPVRVSVPSSYDAPGQWVTPLSRTVAETVRSADTEPSGCAS
jgi:hypothetical protein